ncbi:hypothetical protein EN933_08480 [Mesorhizobium sp. M7A.F.Ca.US.001.01.1.1]|nr:hypothetical protein EN933_08480 [Mesorhizobium sp. M7A.F.Ca.US.001.01.1.1]
MNRKSNKIGSSGIQPKGFDFGTPALYVRTFDPEWINHLTKSGVVGCAYGWANAPSLRARIPTLSLVVRDEVLAKKAFDEFAKWAEHSDDDAVELTIVFLNSGGYLLGLSPEPSRRSARTIVPALFDPLVMFEAWIKTLDTTSAPVRDLETYSKGLVAPIMLDAVSLPPGVTQLSTAVSFKPVAEIKPFLKFSSTFVSEDSKDISLAAEMILETHRNRGTPRRAPSMGRKNPFSKSKHWVQKRRAVLREMFPISLFRARNSGLVSKVEEKLSRHKLSGWQIEQAICNLVLSERIGNKRKHYENLEHRKLLDAIVAVAPTYVEDADGADTMAAITADDVVSQLRLDVAYLIDFLGEQMRDTRLGAQLAVLKRRGYLGEE